MLCKLVKMEESDTVSETIFEEAKKATRQLLLGKSREHYEKVFLEFNKWKEEREVMIINKKVLLLYFLNLKKRYAISFIWSKYSMLKAAIKVYKNIDIGKYSKLMAYLENQSRGYNPKKVAVLERAHVEEFLTRACDKEYLMIKVALIVAVPDGCQCCKLTNLRISGVEDRGSYLIVSITDTKTGDSQKFTIIEEGFSINTVEKCRK